MTSLKRGSATAEYSTLRIAYRFISVKIFQNCPKSINQSCVIQRSDRFSLPKQSKKSRYVLEERSRLLGLFCKENPHLINFINRRKTVGEDLNKQLALVL